MTLLTHYIFSPAHKVFHAYDAGGDVDISGGVTDLPWDTEVYKDDIFDHSADSAEITINEDGWFEIEVEITTYVTSGTSRSESRIDIYHVTDAGQIAGTLAIMYNRTAAQGGDTCKVKRIIEVSSGDTIKVRGWLESGSNTIKTFPEGCRITIKSL